MGLSGHFGPYPFFLQDRQAVFADLQATFVCPFQVVEEVDLDNFTVDLVAGKMDCGNATCGMKLNCFI